LEEADYAKVVTEISRICTEGMKNLTTTETTQELNGK
jgi:hypothetical protein